MELILGYEILESYKRLPYKTWFALAEFIDNSTQSYRNNKEFLDRIYSSKGEKLKIEVNYLNRGENSFISITDNAFGMDKKDLQNALTLGKKPAISNERSKYGLGLKTAAFWFGNEWEIQTTQYGSSEKFIVNVDLKNILEAEKKYYSNSNESVSQFKPSLPIRTESCKHEEHGTKLIINKLVKKITPQNAANCIEYLQSIYRIDLKNNILDLRFQDISLSWNQNEIDKSLLKDENNVVFKRPINFEINGKSVNGWAGILAKGGRKFGGFSLIQADRVIVGFPKSYKNSMLFGLEEGGRNDLLNQRLIGELELDENFAVSHTKDQILFAEEEEEELDQKLYSALADYKKEANTPFKKRKELEEDYQTSFFDFNVATELIIQNLKTPKFTDTLRNTSILPSEVIKMTNDEAVTRLINLGAKTYTYELDGISIHILLSENSSPFDPYLIVRPLGGERAINLVININHPYWVDLEDNVSRFHFLLNCIYDGVSEWKAEFLLAQMDSETIKMIKDSLLRLELTIKI